MNQLRFFEASGKTIDTIVSIGGGAKNETWLQIQADIFNANIVKLASEQGPGMGAAILAAYGCGWFDSLDQCADVFIDTAKVYEPIPENVEAYRSLFTIYQEVYRQTQEMSKRLKAFR